MTVFSIAQPGSSIAQPGSSIAQPGSSIAQPGPSIAQKWKNQEIIRKYKMLAKTIKKKHIFY